MARCWHRRLSVIVVPLVKDNASGVVQPLDLHRRRPGVRWAQLGRRRRRRGAYRHVLAATSPATSARRPPRSSSTPPRRSSSSRPNPETPPTVTPNGDTTGERVTLPFSVSEAGALTVTVADATAKIVRTLKLPVAAGAGFIAWDGRNAAGAAVADGRYTLAFRPTDAAGNRGDPATAEVDVYAALQGLARSPSLFFPQDGDALGRGAPPRPGRSGRPAAVTVRVLDASGTVVRAPMTGRALPAGAGSWTWSGKTDAGAWAPRGTYRIVVTATNGTQSASQAATVTADAFRITTSTPGATRGMPITVSVSSAEGARDGPEARRAAARAGRLGRSR